MAIIGELQFTVMPEKNGIDKTVCSGWDRTSTIRFTSPGLTTTLHSSCHDCNDNNTEK